MIITTNDYERLTRLPQPSSLKTQIPNIHLMLNESLKEAKLIAQEKISKNVITMNSRVVLKHLDTNLTIELTLAYPKDADASKLKVSIFSYVGVALLGRQVGDETSWNTPSGNGRFKILKITYQPEAVGDFSL
ncbi:MAG: GreA/GreB family elongation factor [Chryseolinea sp.]